MSIGYGAYDNFGEQIVGPAPIRMGRGTMEVSSETGSKSYSFEAGITPQGLIVLLAGGALFVHLIRRMAGG